MKKILFFLVIICSSYYATAQNAYPYPCMVDTVIGNKFNYLEDSLIRPYDDAEHIRPIMDTLQNVPKNVSYKNGYVEFTIGITTTEGANESVVPLVIRLTQSQYELLVIWKESHI